MEQQRGGRYTWATPAGQPLGLHCQRPLRWGSFLNLSAKPDNQKEAGNGVASLHLSGASGSPSTLKMCGDSVWQGSIHRRQI